MYRVSLQIIFKCTNIIFVFSFLNEWHFVLMNLTSSKAYTNTYIYIYNNHIPVCNMVHKFLN